MPRAVVATHQGVPGCPDRNVSALAVKIGNNKIVYQNFDCPCWCE